MQPARAQVTLEIELDSEPIQGSLSDRHAAGQPFSGWIELVSLLQTAATTAAAQAHHSRPPPDGHDPS
jgi:hypothetical protein